MKKNLFLLSLIWILFACSKKEVIDENFAGIIDGDRELIFPPDIDGDPNITPTAIVKPSPDWRNWETITLSSGAVVTVPWSDNGPTLNFNEDIYLDFEPEDGWDLIWTTITDQPNRDPEVNYLFFYNRLSGILRVFYYNETSNIQNGGLWEVQLSSSSNSLLNVCSDHFSYPIKYKNKFLYNAVKNPTKGDSFNDGFGRGWNYFQIELAYDPTYATDLRMSISPCNMEVSHVNINASYNFYSEGTIVSSSKKDYAKGLKDGLATSSGKAGSKWIVEKLKAKKKTADIITQGTSAIIKSGVNLVLGSFLGFTQKTQTTTQKLQFTTTGKANLEGTITKSGVGGLPGVDRMRVFADENFQERLGLWNLEDDPVIYINSYAYCPGGHGDSMDGGHHGAEGNWEENIKEPFTEVDGEFTYKFISHVGVPKIVINPAVAPYIKNYTCKTNVVRYYNYNNMRSNRENYENLYVGTIPYNKYIERANGLRLDQIIYEDENGENLFTEADDIAKILCPAIMCSGRKIDLKSMNVGLSPDLVVKVTIQFDMEYQGKEHTLYSSRTYKPRYEWYEN